jgi:hypothetical protein
MNIPDQFKNSVILRNGVIGSSELNNIIHSNNQGVVNNKKYNFKDERAEKENEREDAYGNINTSKEKIISYKERRDEKDRGDRDRDRDRDRDNRDRRGEFIFDKEEKSRFANSYRERSRDKEKEKERFKNERDVREKEYSRGGDRQEQEYHKYIYSIDDRIPRQEVRNIRERGDIRDIRGGDRGEYGYQPYGYQSVGNNIPSSTGLYNYDNYNRDIRDIRENRGDNRDNRDNRDIRENRGENRDNREYKPYQTEFYSNPKITYEENGELKSNISILVPDALVSLLIGNHGGTVKDLMQKTGAHISFSKDHKSDHKVLLDNKVLGRVCSISGTLDQNMKAIGKMYELIINFENNRKKND